jgi:EAL domain-containing protein (putative c-di-GMP-specific phosphodiesterase class I)/FixJ family two-component response regulator
MANATLPLSRLSVLVVDDDQISRRLAAGILRSVGIEQSAEATNGFEALTHLKRAEGSIDIVLCDLEMEGMDGIEFLTELADHHPEAAVILVSGMHRSVMAAVEEMSKNTGLRVLGTVEKPLDRKRLVALLDLMTLPGQSPATKTVAERFSHAEIQDGLRQHQFMLYYQPKVDLRNGRLIGAEALARWQHPTRGMILPTSFIPAAEQGGVIIDLTWSLLEEALRTASCWHASGLDISLSVNITVGFLEELAVTENIIALTNRLNVPANRIVLEITESMATTDMVQVIGNLARLRMRGYGLAIDDFGTGYSTMQQLSRIPFNELKVDRSFIEGAARQADVRAILESSLELGRRLRLQTTAEGIETLDELAMLKSIGCDTAQGFLFARPMAGAAFSAWANEWNHGGQLALRQMIAVH